MVAVALSVVVPAYNEAHELPNLLSSLRPILGDMAYEVIVVDNGSTDRTGEIALEYGVRLVKIEKGTPGRGRNEGARVSRGARLVFIDADVTVTPEWLATISALTKQDVTHGVITGDVYDVVENSSWLERYWFGAIYRRGVSGYINGGNLILSSSDFAKLGGFDEVLTSGEDVEFCQRARALGMRILPNRALRVLHAGYPSTSRRFVAREAWHGQADYRSVAAYVRSPVAMVATLFLAAHLSLIVGAVMGNLHLSLVAVVFIVACCFGSSLWKWRREPLKVRLMNSAVFYLYFVGRSLAAFRQFGSLFASR